MLDTGAEAPDFELPDHNGDPVRRSDFEGERLVLYFYPKAGTEGCSVEARGFRDAWESFADRGVQVVGVSTDAPEDLAAFRAANDIPFPLLSDADGAVARAYDTFGTTSVDGETFEIAFRNTYVIGPDGTIEATYEGVSPDSHAEELLADLPAGPA